MSEQSDAAQQGRYMAKTAYAGLRDALSEKTIYVVVRVTGEYSDRREQLLFAVPDEDRAKQLVLDAVEEWRCANAIHPMPEWPDATDDAAYHAFEAAVKVRNAAFRSLMTVDPDVAPEGHWGASDEPYYHYDAVAMRLVVPEPSDVDRTWQRPIWDNGYG